MTVLKIEGSCSHEPMKQHVQEKILEGLISYLCTMLVPRYFAFRTSFYYIFSRLCLGVPCKLHSHTL